MYWAIGQRIVEKEQQGRERAAYGKEVLKRLSVRLTEQYGKGWSEYNLENCRKLFLNYSITEPVVRKSHTFLLPWSHYLILMREKNPQARKFYEIEAYNQQWSKRQLQRQIASSLYERLALSRDKDEVMRQNMASNSSLSWRKTSPYAMGRDSTGRT